MTTGQRHDGEIRDAVHGFVRIEHDEWDLLDSPFVRRLRNIHQLALTYLVYPGATHKRFEHSMGVMELAGRVYDVITDPRRADPNILRLYHLDKEDVRLYWRKVVRMAGLCHDIGHLPFSHAAEGTILGGGRTHENLSAELILSEEMAELWKSLDPPLKPLDVAKVAIGSRPLPDDVVDRDLPDLLSLLHDIIDLGALGVDRVDYLLRDSLHTGVAYGRFDHLRLLDTIRILPRSSNSDSPALGLEEGGVHTAEALLLARYFMFMQVYYHRVRAAYDAHLQDFLREWLESHPLNVSIQELTDIDVLVEIEKASKDDSLPGNAYASRIANRQHFRLAYSVTTQDRKRAEDALEQYLSVLQKHLGKENARSWSDSKSNQSSGGFPVKTSDGSIASFRELSEVLEDLPSPAASYLLVPSDSVATARKLISDYELEVR